MIVDVLVGVKMVEKMVDAVAAEMKMDKLQAFLKHLDQLFAYPFHQAFLFAA